MFVSAVLFYAHWLSCLTLAKSHSIASIIHFICRHGRKMMDKRRQQQQQQKQKLQNVPYKISKISLFVHTLTMLDFGFSPSTSIFTCNFTERGHFNSIFIWYVAHFQLAAMWNSIRRSNISFNNVKALGTMKTDRIEVWHKNATSEIVEALSTSLCLRVSDCRFTRIYH